MKKQILLLCLPLLITGCSKKDNKVEENSNAEKVSVEATAIVAPKIIKEVEPNNRFNDASGIKASQVGQGFISFSGDQKNDVDWWEFEVIEKSQVSIELSGLESMDLAFSLHSDRDPAEAIIKAFSNSDSDKEKLSNLGEVYPAINLDPGKYYVKVFQFKKKAKDKDLSDAENPYNLTITFNSVDNTLESEPNERAVEASLLPIGESRFGYLGVKSDLDWWKVVFPEGVTGNNALKVTLKSPSKVKPSLLLKNDIDAVLKEIGAQKDGGETLVIPAYVLKDYQTPIFVVVNGRWNHNTSEKYELNAELVPLDIAFEEESNDRAVEATAINETMFIRGYIDQGKILDVKPWRQSDEDWYKLTLDEEKAITVTLSGLEAVDLVLSMYNEDGTEKLITVNDNDKKEGEVIAPVWMKNALFKVSAKSSSQFNVDQPYELQIRPYEVTKPIEREPNDKKEQATVLDLSAEGAKQGWLNPKEDVDFYSLDMSKYGAGNYTLKVTGIPVVPIKVTVLDEADAVIASQEKSMDKDPVNIDLQLEDKAYFVKIEHGGKKALSNPRDSYSVSLIRGNN